MLTELRLKLAEKMAQNLSMDKGEIEGLFEVPKQISHGHLALPVFFLAKKLKKAPPLIAKDLAEKINQENWEGIEEVVPIGGYLNFHFDDKVLQEELIQSVIGVEHIGFSDSGKGKTMAIDFSSPNVAKPMSIGHLRATAIGQAIVNLAKTQGYKILGINHLGDWGVQFGKLAWAYQQWSEEYPFEEKPFDSLFKLYVRFHNEAESNEELEKEGSLVFKKLEEGDPEIEKLWEKFITISMKEYGKLWDLMGVKHDLVQGESFYNDKLAPTEKLLEEKGLLIESQGAMVVDLESDDMPPCLIRKSDGASLYATRDLAAAIYRKEELKSDLILYVVGVEQTLHFRQLFKVLEKMGFDWAKDCHHVSFGLYKFKDIGKMSTRKGNVIFLEDVMSKAIDMVKELIEKKNPDLEDKELVAKQVGVGAVVFNDLMNDRVKDVDFNWDRVLDFEGDSGPYVQYCQVRCQSLINKYGKEVPKEFSLVLESDEERELIKGLLQYKDVLASSFKHFKPHIVAAYLLDVCRLFNHFYHKHRILGEEESVEASRMTLVYLTQKILVQGLATLNIESPKAM